MKAQEVFNVIFMIMLIVLIVADSTFMFISVCAGNWDILIGALSGVLMVLFSYGLHILCNLKV